MATDTLAGQPLPSLPLVRLSSEPRPLVPPTGLDRRSLNPGENGHRTYITSLGERSMTTKTVVTHHSWKERELEPEDGSNRMTVCGDISVKLDVANVIIIETQGNLFTCPSYFSLAHCVSEDMVMSRGIATAFKRKFEGIGELKAQGLYNDDD